MNHDFRRYQVHGVPISYVPILQFAESLGLDYLKVVIGVSLDRARNLDIECWFSILALIT